MPGWMPLLLVPVAGALLYHLKGILRAGTFGYDSYAMTREDDPVGFWGMFCLQSMAALSVVLFLILTAIDWMSL
jgi:hypothetical protein